MRIPSSSAHQRAAAGEIGEADELPYSLDRLFQALVYGSDSLALQWLLERFEVVALPGAGLERKLERGDLVLRGGDGPLVHAFLVADPVMRSAEEILRQAGRPEVGGPGGFVYVAEQGVVPHTQEDRFARRVTDERDRVRRRQAVLRAREGGGEGERVDLTSLMVGMTLANVASRPREVVRVEVNSKDEPPPRPPADESLPWADSGEAGGPAERPCTAIIADSERGERGAESLTLTGDPSDPHRWATLFEGAERTKVEPLIDGAAAFRAMRDAIETATTAGHFIYILGWMFDIDLPLVPGDANSTLDGLLTAAVRRGVQLRILIWDNLEEDYNKKAMDAIARLRATPGKLGRRADLVAVHLDANNFLPKKSRELLQDIAPTVRELQRIVKTYRRYMPASLIPDDYYLTRAAQFSDPHSTHSIGAHHEKVTIVNGSQGLIGFCGGIDFNCNRIGQGWCGPAFLPLPKTPSLHDVACRLQGPAIRKLFEKFKTRWTHHPETSQESLIEPAAAAFAMRDGQVGAPLVRVVGTYNSPDGSIRDRSLMHAYFKIIDTARRHIYIEDQYGVHPDVAKHLNARLRDPSFEQLIIVLQDASETSDILIPNRKREEFRKALFSGLTDTQRDKAIVAIYDAAKAEQRHLHRGMHAKTLIADDEIAIIGSANVNRRSFTCDSESSVVIIDDPGQGGQSIVRRFRRNTWKEHAGGAFPDAHLDNWVLFARYIGLAIASWPSLLNIRRFDAPDVQDLDVRIRFAVELAKKEGELLSYSGIPGSAIGGGVSKVAAWVLRVMPKAVEDLWNLIIDPNVDEQ